MSTNNVICTICAERYRNSDNIHAGTCGHAFHEACLFRWQEQSRSCPICRSEDAAYFQLYLSFENEGAGGSGGGGRNERQNNSSSSSSSNSSSSSSSSSSVSSSGFMREYENMLYEKDLYQQEIKYLNECIEKLNLASCRLAESESDTDYENYI
ncbi:hypothetical protein KR054_006412 [Drosophila jambulina]|nr:hypothetical protein KR054_006412 [Drosophila jambulina]